MGLPFSVTWCFSIEVCNMQWAFFVLFIWYFSCVLFWFCLVSCEPFGSGWAMLPPPYFINLLLLFYWKYFLFLWHESFLCFHNSWILSLYMFLEILNVPLICFLWNLLLTLAVWSNFSTLSPSSEILSSTWPTDASCWWSFLQCNVYLTHWISYFCRHFGWLFTSVFLSLY